MSGKGGFAVSFYVLLELKRNSSGQPKVPTIRGVRKLPCGLQSLLVIRRATPHNLCAEYFHAS